MNGVFRGNECQNGQRKATCSGRNKNHPWPRTAIFDSHHTQSVLSSRTLRNDKMLWQFNPIEPYSECTHNAEGQNVRNVVKLKNSPETNLFLCKIELDALRLDTCQCDTDQYVPPERRAPRIYV